MKKLSGVFICLLLFTVLSSARIIEVADAGITDKLKAVIAAKNAGAPAGCTTANDSQLIHVDEVFTSASPFENNSHFKCQKHTITTGSTITEYIQNLRESTGANTYTLQLYEHDSGNDYPDETAPIANTAVTLGHADIPGVAADVTFTLASPTVVNETTVWLCGNATDMQPDWSYIVAGSERVCYSTDWVYNTSATYTCYDDDGNPQEIWGCTP